MTSRRPRLEDVLHRAVRSELATVHTSMPGRVLSYDAVTQRATVQLTVRFSRRDPDTGERIPYEPEPLPNVPILWPTGGAGDYSDTWPLTRGDEVWVLFAERSIDEWTVTGNDVVTPASVRRFNLSDAVAMPAKSSRREALPEDAAASGARVIRGPEIRLGSASASKEVALAPDVESELADIQAALAQVDTQLRGLGLAGISPPYTAGSVGAAKVKAE